MHIKSSVSCSIMLSFLYLGSDKSLYTIRAVPFSDIRSIRRHTPTLGWQYAIIVLSSGTWSCTIVSQTFLFYTSDFLTVVSIEWFNLFCCEKLVYLLLYLSLLEINHFYFLNYQCYHSLHACCGFSNQYSISQLSLDIIS